MWVCLSDSFLSIVDNSNTKGELLVRARRRGDIEKVFPDAKVTSAAGRDYLFRASVKRELVSEAMHKQVMGINYPNFKDSVKNNALHNAYADVWGTMSRLQETPPYHIPFKGTRSYNAPTVLPKLVGKGKVEVSRQAEINALKRGNLRGR